MYVVTHMTLNHNIRDVNGEYQLSPEARLGVYRCPTCAESFDCSSDVRDHCWRRAHYVIPWVNRPFQVGDTVDDGKYHV